MLNNIEMPIYREIIVLFLSLLFINSGFAGDWKVVRKQSLVKDTLYSIRKNKFNLDNQYVFFSETDFDQIVKGGIHPIITKNKLYPDIIWKIKPDLPIAIDKKNVGFYFNVYVNNVNYFEMVIHDEISDLWYRKKYKIFYNGYQRPFMDSGDTKEYSNEISSTEILKDTITERLIKIDEINIIIHPKNDDFNFVVGELQILRVVNDIAVLKHPFFESVFEESIPEELYESNYKGNPTLFTVYSFDNIGGGSNLEIVADGKSDISEKDILLRFFKMCIDHYPFYKERDIKKDEIVEMYVQVLQDSIKDIFLVARHLDVIARKFGDGHFRIIVPSNNNTASVRPITPIRIVEINNKYYVSAIFDSSFYGKGLSVGQQVYRINNTPLSLIIDSLCFTDQLTREAALNRCISRMPGDSILLNIKTSSNDSIISLYYNGNRKLVIPPNFIPKHGGFRIIDQNITYLRLNNFIPGDYIRVLNYIDTIQSSKGIIIDLRGNGGGNSSISMQIFSLFIKVPSVYNHHINIYQNRRTNVVKPNPFFLIDQPVVILVDKNTACASEAFAEAMRYNKRAVIIGKEKTGGVYASLYEFSLPSGIMIKCNVLSDYYLVASGLNVENKGITPDIWVDIMKVKDLYPYEDKCLKYATNLLSNFSIN